MTKTTRQLTDQDIETICTILDGWPVGEKLTWEALLEDIERRLYLTWSRQALNRHTRITQAFKLRKRGLQKSVPVKNPENIPADLRKAMERAQRLESENERLKLENNQLLEQFMRWAYNAEAKGLTLNILNKPLHNVDRGSTRSSRA
jgi:hypothetical protein